MQGAGGLQYQGGRGRQDQGHQGLRSCISAWEDDLLGDAGSSVLEGPNGSDWELQNHGFCSPWLSLCFLYAWG